MVGRSKIDGGAAWEAIATAARRDRHEERLAAIGEAANRLVGAAGCSFYRIEQNRLELEMRVGQRGSDGNSSKGKVNPLFNGFDHASEGAAGATGSTQLVLSVDPSRLTAGTFEKGGDLFIRLPLLDEGGEVVGLYESGPFSSSRRAGAALKTATALAGPLAFTLQVSRRQNDLERRISELDEQVSIGKRLVRSSLHAERAYGLLLKLAIDACRSDAGVIIRVTEDGTELVVSQDVPPPVLSKLDLTPGGGLVDFLPGSEDCLVVTDATALAQRGVRSLVAVPITDGGLKGVVGLLGLGSDAQLVEHAGTVLEQFARQVSMIMETEELARKFALRSWEELVGLCRTLDARFDHTAGHHQLVSDIAARIAGKLGLDPDVESLVKKAGLVHDVGLSGLAESTSAFEADFQHPNTGAHLVEVVADAGEVAAIVRVHHEWYSGYGFPRGLKGDEIPTEGYALAAAEYLAESLVLGPSHPKPSFGELRSQAKGRMGNQLHPECGRAALDVIDEMEEEQAVDEKEGKAS